MGFTYLCHQSQGHLGFLLCYLLIICSFRLRYLSLLVWKYLGFFLCVLLVFVLYIVTRSVHDLSSKNLLQVTPFKKLLTLSVYHHTFHTEQSLSIHEEYILSMGKNLFQLTSTKMPTRLLWSMEFSRQEYWSVGSHFLLQGIFLTQGSNHISWIAGRFFTFKPPGKPQNASKCSQNIVASHWGLNALQKKYATKDPSTQRATYRPSVSMVTVNSRVLRGLSFLLHHRHQQLDFSYGCFSLH